MGYMVRVSGPGVVELVQYQDPPQAPHEARLHTVMGLAARRRLDLGALVTQVISVEEAASAFAILDRQPDQALQILLKF
jgi:threonine dehydrogenase-like Zn-dependent dehydrogenase